MTISGVDKYVNENCIMFENDTKYKKKNLMHFNKGTINMVIQVGNIETAKYRIQLTKNIFSMCWIILN